METANDGGQYVSPWDGIPDTNNPIVRAGAEEMREALMEIIEKYNAQHQSSKSIGWNGAFDIYCVSRIYRDRMEGSFGDYRVVEKNHAEYEVAKAKMNAMLRIYN